MLVAFAYMGVGPVDETPQDDGLVAQYLIDFRRKVRMQFHSYVDSYIIDRPLNCVDLPLGWDFLVRPHDENYVVLEIFPIKFWLSTVFIDLFLRYGSKFLCDLFLFNRIPRLLSIVNN